MMFIKHFLTIVKKNQLTSMKMLKAHPKVKRVLEAPRDLVLYEFYDELYEILWNEDRTVRRRFYSEPDFMHRKREVLREEHSLLEPLYALETIDKFVTGFSFATENCHYTLLLDIIKRRYIDGDVKSAYPHSDLKNIKIVVRFRRLEAKNIAAYEKLVKEWTAWGQKEGLIVEVTSLDVKDNLVTINASFTMTYEDPVAILLAILNDTKSKTTIDWIKF